MKFGPVPVEEAEGAILAYSLKAGERRLKKGLCLTAEDIATLRTAGIAEVTVARLEPDDMPEDEAAQTLARALVPDAADAALRLGAPFAGRVNIQADAAGLVQVDAAAVHRFNAVDPAITVATLPDMKRVAAGALVATVKVIPYAVDSARVAGVLAGVNGALRVVPFKVKTAGLVLTEVPDMKPSVLEKGRRVVEARLNALGITLEEVEMVPHTEAALAEALARVAGEVILILTGSATSDANDVGPQALRAAGGRLERFGMPVDPGNLLFLGALGRRPVVGLPGCARSPALNGADWVLERLACGLEVRAQDIATMGVGGLLKEIPTRPQPRSGLPDNRKRPKVEILLLAAGASRRMQGRDKLLEDVGGKPMLRHAAEVALASAADRVHVVLPPDATARRDALAGLDLDLHEAPDRAEGMAASVRAGIAALSDDCDAVVLAFGDMPDVTPADFDALVAAFDPVQGREICRAVTESGKAGHPVLFGRRFFESLAALAGDRGARDVLRGAPEYLHDVETAGEGAVTDLDTPADWAAWRDLAGN